MNPKFSICIPNYNYEHYIDLMLDSVIKQSFNDFEVVISDNASSDRSVEIIEKYIKNDSRISYKINTINIGFAANLDEAGRLAKGDWMIMLSSDDIICKDTLAEYNKFIQFIPQDQLFSITSTFEKIDSNGNFIEYISPKNINIWRKTDIDFELSQKMEFDVYKVNNRELLNRCIKKFQNPFNFSATCFPSALYGKVGGYGGSRLINPDKWFHWKIISQSEYSYFLDKPLFKYRWHQNNQIGLQQKSGVIKLWLDEYRNCFECSEAMLKQADLTQIEIQKNFCIHLNKYILRSILNKEIEMANRLWNFGLAAYPDLIKSTTYSILVRFSLFTYPISALLLQQLRKIK